MEQVHGVVRKSKRKTLRPIQLRDIENNQWEDAEGQRIDSQHLLISMLLPPAVKAFFEELESEVKALCGKRYSHGSAAQRWGSQPGSIILGNQKVSIQKRRIRGLRGKEIALETYARFQDPSLFDQHVFQEGIKHVSQRDYEKGLPKIAASFGVSRSSVSRSWMRSTKKQVERLLHRKLDALRIVAVFIDGKRFSKLGVVVALGVGEDGKKHVLGIYQSSTENSTACRELLDDLERRGLPERGLLFCVDGGSGLNKALNDKYQIHDPQNRRAYRVRCFFHKWNNLKDVLDQKAQDEAKPLFWAIRNARDMVAARACSDSLEACLRKYNVSALQSYLEAKQDLLAIHGLSIDSQLKKFFSTTNPIESLNSLLEEDLRRVKRWRDSEHFQRWMASACLQNEKRMRRIRGYRGLPALLVRLPELCLTQDRVDTKSRAA